MRSRLKTWVFRGDHKNPDDVNSKESLVNLESFGMMTRIEKTKGNTWAKTYPSILKAFETRTPRKEKSSPPKLFPYNSQFLVEQKTLKIEHIKRFFFKTSRSAISRILKSPSQELYAKFLDLWRERASERSFRESEREGNPGRDDRKHFLVTGRRRQFRRLFCMELSSSTRPWLFLIPLKYHPPYFSFLLFLFFFLIFFL